MPGTSHHQQQQNQQQQQQQQQLQLLQEQLLHQQSHQGQKWGGDQDGLCSKGEVEGQPEQQQSAQEQQVADPFDELACANGQRGGGEGGGPGPPEVEPTFDATHMWMQEGEGGIWMKVKVQMWMQEGEGLYGLQQGKETRVYGYEFVWGFVHEMTAVEGICAVCCGWL